MIEKNNASSSVLLNVLKNYKKDSPKRKTLKKKEHSLNKQSSDNSFDPIQFIEKLPTYEKICILQSLLKEIISIRGRFEKNKDIMLERIINNCKVFYKNQIGMKAIYDYCKSDNPEKYYNYVLEEKNEERFGKENYEIINTVIFLLRNNNDLLLNLVNNCPKNSFNELADFLVNFFFNNTIDSSFNEDELLIFIYLIIEQHILNEETGLENDRGYLFYNNNLVYYIFKYLTRKPDIRSYTYSILSNYIIQFEEYNDTISIETKILNNECMQGLRNNSVNRTMSDVKTMNINNKSDSFSFSPENPSVLNDIPKTFTYSSPLNRNLITNIEDFLNDKEEDSDDKFDLNIDTIHITLDPFFEESNLTLEYLQEVFSEYEQKNDNDNITIAMKTYIFNLINDLGKNPDIFSNKEKISTLKKYIVMNNENENLNEKIKNNYNKITKCIDDIIDSFNENVISLPYILKSINSILYFLLNKKYSNEKIQNTEYHTLIFLSNFLLGNIIIPLLSNPYFNGILTKGVLSKMAKENLEIISKILKQIISGKLFSIEKDPEYTIFNKYIIKTLPKIFEITNKINSQKNFKLSQAIRNLINSYENPQRNVNYNFFEENQENIQLQNICFSWIDLIIFIDMFNANNNLDKIEVYQKNKEIFDKFLEMKGYFYNEYNGNNIDLQTDFFLFEKINYSPYLSNQINTLLQENFILRSKDEDEKVFLFKKYFVEILSFINKLTDNNSGFSKNDSRELINNEKEKDYLMNREYRYNKYLQIFSEEEEEEEEITDDINMTSPISYENKEKIDIDFKSTILPNIIDTITNEFGHNLDTTTSKRIAFYASYLQIHIEELDSKYKEKNYSLLIMEIIQKLESIFKGLNFVIINQIYLKVKDGTKLNMIIRNNFLQTKKMEKCICIQYLFDKLNLPCKLNIVKDESGKITKINYEKITSDKSKINSIQSFIDNFPNFRELFSEEEDIIDCEENIELDVALNAYLKDLKGLLKNETIMERYSKEEFDSIMFELENYILYKLYTKLFPATPTKKDTKFYNKCCRLSFLKPEALIKDKNAINEKLWEASIILINELDEKFTPVDKVEKFGKAFAILQNSLTFSSGKGDLGIDDTISILIYVIMKAKPKNLFSNSKYCQLFLNVELSKRLYGILLSQIEMVKNIIYNMKYTDLIGVTEEEFGKDEE